MWCYHQPCSTPPLIWGCSVAQKCGFLNQILSCTASSPERDLKTYFTFAANLLWVVLGCESLPLSLEYGLSPYDLWKYADYCIKNNEWERKREGEKLEKENTVYVLMIYFKKMLNKVLSINLCLGKALPTVCHFRLMKFYLKKIRSILHQRREKCQGKRVWPVTMVSCIQWQHEVEQSRLHFQHILLIDDLPGRNLARGRLKHKHKSYILRKKTRTKCKLGGWWITRMDMLNKCFNIRWNAERPGTLYIMLFSRSFSLLSHNKGREFAYG